jgi:hypothetical protein
VEVYFHAFLISALDAGEWSASLPGRLTPEVRAADVYWIGGWVAVRAGLDEVTKGKKVKVKVNLPLCFL